MRKTKLLLLFRSRKVMSYVIAFSVSLVFEATMKVIEIFKREKNLQGFSLTEIFSRYFVRAGSILLRYLEICSDIMDFNFLSLLAKIVLCLVIC